VGNIDGEEEKSKVTTLLNVISKSYNSYLERKWQDFPALLLLFLKSGFSKVE
jgi:hypothetical protein